MFFIKCFYHFPPTPHPPQMERQNSGSFETKYPSIHSPQSTFAYFNEVCRNIIFCFYDVLIEVKIQS